MSLTAEEWRVAVWNFFDPAYLFANDLTDADLNDHVIQEQLEDIFQSLENGNASFVQKALPAIEIVGGRTYQLNAGVFQVRLSLLADLQRAVKRRTCELGLPELIRNTDQTTPIRLAFRAACCAQRQRAKRCRFRFSCRWKQTTTTCRSAPTVE